MITFSSASLYTENLDDVFRTAVEGGAEGVEIMIDKRQQTQDSIYLKNLVRKYGLPIRSIHGPFLITARRVWGGSISKIKRTVAMAEDLGAGLIVIHLPYKWQLDYAKWLKEDLEEFCDSTNVQIAIENAVPITAVRKWNFTKYNSLDELCKFRRITLDTSHISMFGKDPTDAYEHLHPRVSHIHLSNNFLRGMDDHALPYEGKVDLEGFLRHIAARNYEGDIALELNPLALEVRKPGKAIKNLSKSVEFVKANFRLNEFIE